MTDDPNLDAADDPGKATPALPTAEFLDAGLAPALDLDTVTRPPEVTP